MYLHKISTTSLPYLCRSDTRARNQVQVHIFTFWPSLLSVDYIFAVPLPQLHKSKKSSASSHLHFLTFTPAIKLTYMQQRQSRQSYHDRVSAYSFPTCHLSTSAILLLTLSYRYIFKSHHTDYLHWLVATSPNMYTNDKSIKVVWWSATAT